MTLTKREIETLMSHFRNQISVARRKSDHKMVEDYRQQLRLLEVAYADRTKQKRGYRTYSTVLVIALVTCILVFAGPAAVRVVEADDGDGSSGGSNDNSNSDSDSNNGNDNSGDNSDNGKDSNQEKQDTTEVKPTESQPANPTELTTQPIEPTQPQPPTTTMPPACPEGQTGCSQPSPYPPPGGPCEANPDPKCIEKHTPDQSCLFHPEQAKCKSDNGKCPEGFNQNEDGNCFPQHEKCPKGFHSHEDDETGRCIPDKIPCEPGFIRDPDFPTCSSKESVCRDHPKLDACIDCPPGFKPVHGICTKDIFINIHKTIHTKTSGSTSMSSSCYAAIKVAWIAKIQRGQNNEVDKIMRSISS